MFDRGLDRRPARRPADRGARAADAGGHDPRAGRGRRRRAARPRRRHRREGRHQRGHGRLPARVPAVGAGRGRGGLHRRVQHPRRAGHDDAGRPGDHLQRPGHAGHRDEQRRQRARAGQPGQPRRSGGRCSSSSATSAAAGRARSTGPRTATRASSRSASPRTRTARRGRSLAESPRRAAPGVDAVTVFAGEGPRCVVDQMSRDARAPGHHRSPRACAPCTTRSCVLGFDAILVVGPEHARVFAEAGWDRERVARRARRAHGCSSRAPSSCSGAGGIAEGMPESPSPTPRCRSSAPAACCSSTPAAAPGCSLPSSAGWANGAIGSQPVTRRGDRDEVTTP